MKTVLAFTAGMMVGIGALLMLHSDSGHVIAKFFRLVPSEPPQIMHCPLAGIRCRLL
jgi:hypothetical protein